METQPRAGDWIALSQWVTTKPLVVNHLGYHLENLEALTGGKAPPAIFEGFDGTEFGPENEAINRWLANRFCARQLDTFNFDLANAIAEFHLDLPTFDALQFPTVAMNGAANNFAVKLSLVASGLQLKKVRWAKVISRTLHEANLTHLDHAIEFPDGSISWKGRLEQWTSQKPGDAVKATYQGNMEWKLIDETGAIREPDA